MPIAITIHSSGQYYASKFEGRITNEELVPVYAAFYTGQKVPVGLPELVDLSLADVSQVSRAGLIELARWAEKLHRQRGEQTKKTAIYLPRSSSRSAAIIYDVWTEGSAELVKVFENQAEAVRWLIE